MRKSSLAVYKDQKHYKSEPTKLHRNENTIELKNAIVELTPDYTKRKHVFRLKSSNGAEYLFEANDDVSDSLMILR